MLTPKQIKNLKPGDKLVHEIRFIEGSGDYINCSFSPLFSSDKTTFLIDRAFLSLPSEQPKHDPCRLFREGDEVRVVERYGREMPFCNYINSGEVYTVARDERDGIVALFTSDGIDCTSWYWLELVTPVEELEPYLMLENVPSNSIEVRDKRTNKVEATFYFGKDHAYTFEQAATRAEAERDRLNDEYRKEHGNG